jgi:hypothetical protein
MAMPSLLKVRSPQRIVTLQHLQHQIEAFKIDASSCAAINRITHDPYMVRFKHIEGHTVLRSREISGACRQILVSGKTLSAVRKYRCSRNSERQPQEPIHAIISEAKSVQNVWSICKDTFLQLLMPPWHRKKRTALQRF